MEAPDMQGLGCILSSLCGLSLLGIFKLIDIVVWIFTHVSLQL